MRGDEGSGRSEAGDDGMTELGGENQSGDNEERTETGLGPDKRPGDERERRLWGWRWFRADV